ncbi:hypothetical protein BD414DRAFT_471600 [Trametes punicea]|nr:hypothetical protein BD414DRAFT_471600 [Trametes punicea]
MRSIAVHPGTIIALVALSPVPTSPSSPSVTRTVRVRTWRVSDPREPSSYPPLAPQFPLTRCGGIPPLSQYPKKRERGCGCGRTPLRLPQFWNIRRSSREGASEGGFPSAANGQYETGGCRLRTRLKSVAWSYILLCESRLF